MYFLLYIVDVYTFVLSYITNTFIISLSPFLLLFILCFLLGYTIY